MNTLLALVVAAGLAPAAVPAHPASEGFVTVEPGVRLFYKKVGDGKNVIVSPMGSWLAGPLASLARPDRTLIFYDTRGRGRSDLVDPKKVSFPNELSDLDALRKHFGLETMALMGWSHYGMMTAVYAIRHPDNVSRVLQITPGTPRSDPYLEEGMAAMQARTDAKAVADAQARKAAGEFDRDPAGLCRALKSARRTASYEIVSAASKMTFDDCALRTEWADNQEGWWTALFESMAPWDVRREARALKTPRLVIHGEKDFIPLGGSREWVEGNASARLLIMKGVGHHPMVEDPETFLSAADAFLDGRWPAGAVELPASAPASGAPAAKPVSELAREARAAYDAGDKAGFLAKYEEIALRRPGDVTVLYNLACGQALNGRTREALATLESLAARRMAADLDADADFESIRGAPEYRAVADRMAAVRKERITSGATAAITLRERGLVPEGVAYDPRTKSFFVSSIRKRKVVRVGAGGAAADFVGPGEGGLRSACGIGVDPARRTLWVASEAMPHMEGYRKEAAPDSALFEFDLDTGKLRREHRPPAVSGEPPAFDDLAVSADGRVWVNDGRSPRIWTLAPGAGKLEVFLESAALRGTQGLAPTPDGRTLYVSDYSGLHRVEIAERRVAPIAVPADLALNGIDGLVYYGGSLYAVQNGIVPHRVLRLELTSDGTAIASGRILEMNHPDFEEPTLATVADGALYVVADSQGERFREAKTPVRPEDMREAVVLKIPISSLR